MHSGELGFREGSEAPPSLPGGQWGGAFGSGGRRTPPPPIFKDASGILSLPDLNQVCGGKQVLTPRCNPEL